MKRILILLLSLMLCLGGLTACGSDKKNDAVNNGPGSGSVIDPDGSVIDPDGSLVDPDGSIGNPSAPNASQPNGGSAAGGDVSGNGSGSMPEGALNNGTVGENPADSRNDADTSNDAARAGRTSTCTTEGETLFRPASYRQMLRNARVHDLDGDLTDGENSVTPGVLH